MPGFLFDSCVWVAAIFPTHPFHQHARAALMETSAAAPAVFCRSTQQSLLRLTTASKLLKQYGAEGLTNHDALVALAALSTLPHVAEREEPHGTVALWHQFASRNSATPKVWMDAYLAAFAIAGGLRLVTLDNDFKAFVSKGLDLVSLNSRSIHD